MSNVQVISQFPSAGNLFVAVHASKDVPWINYSFLKNETQLAGKSGTVLHFSSLASHVGQLHEVLSKRILLGHFRQFLQNWIFIFQNNFFGLPILGFIEL